MLDDLDARGIKHKYESVRIEYAKVAHYKPDIVLPNGVLIEAKGWFKPADRTKMLLVKEQHPDLDIRLLFQNANNLLSKKSKTTYAKWSDKHGFKWAEGRVPNDWVL